jgi:hypothetical protein
MMVVCDDTKHGTETEPFFSGLCLHKPQGKMSVNDSKTRNVLAGLPPCNCIK